MIRVCRRVLKHQGPARCEQLGGFYLAEEGAGGFFLGLTSRCAAGDPRPRARRAVRAPQPACQGYARYCAVGALNILRGCAARRSWPEGLIADLSLMITSAPNENVVPRAG